MFLKSIKLQNIRSYESQQVDFPLGSVLLAGDIGSGKSTVMLAIEFAIFGVKKGELPGYTLLRHGKREGYVELHMQIDSNDIVIKRSLKRSNDEIKQESGYIITNGSKREGTAEELRAWMLDMLGYPKGLVKRGKDLIYRYTVYTPQEEMKLILYQDNETRLETLRKIFNIDKYKRIRDNSRIIMASLREKRKQLEGYVMDLDFRKKDLEEKESEISRLKVLIEEIGSKYIELKDLIDTKKKSLEKLESEIKTAERLRKDISVTEASLKLRIEQNNSLNEDLRKLESQIEALRKELEGKQPSDMNGIAKRLEDKEKELNETERLCRSSIKKIEELRAKMGNSAEIVKKIGKLDFCPLCEQKVDESHKHETIARETKKNEEISAQIVKSKEEEKELESLRTRLKSELDVLVKEQHHFNLLKYKFENLDEKERIRKERIESKENIRKEIGLLNSRKMELSAQIRQHSDAEERYRMAKTEIDALLPQERFFELEKKRYETEIESLNKQVRILEKDINEKELKKKKIVRLACLNDWLENFFVKLMSTIERHVMVNIQVQFNEFFKKWFGILMEDDNISARIDDNFTPIIEQDGYETYIENLSGGERTSVALAYRLSLNKVINDIVSTIKTKDIIMLDEPTDGFSTEQLDKVRVLLDELNMKQVIIVSHESKIESFVQNVMRVQKRDNVSGLS